MLVKKAYHFYAAHRNELLKGTKCENLHGHTYHLTCYFKVKRQEGSFNVTTLFEDFDTMIEPWIKTYWDHSTIIHCHDPLYEPLHEIERAMKLKVLGFPTSVENIAFQLFDEIVKNFHLPLVRIDLQETISSTVVYTDFDYERDLNYLKGQNYDE